MAQALRIVTLTTILTAMDPTTTLILTGATITMMVREDPSIHLAAAVPRLKALAVDPKSNVKASSW